MSSFNNYGIFTYMLSVDIPGINICIGQQASCGIVTLTVFCNSDSECLRLATVIRNTFCS